MNLGYYDLQKLNMIYKNRLPIFLINSSASSINDAKTVIFQSDLMTYSDSFRIYLNENLKAQEKEHMYIMPLRDAMRWVYRKGNSDYILVDECLRKSIVPTTPSDVAAKMQRVNIPAMYRAKIERTLNNLRRYNTDVIKAIYSANGSDLYHTAVLLNIDHPIVLQATLYKNGHTWKTEFYWSTYQLISYLLNQDYDDGVIDLYAYVGGSIDVKNLTAGNLNHLTSIAIEEHCPQCAVDIIKTFYPPIDVVAELRDAEEANHFVQCEM